MAMCGYVYVTNKSFYILYTLYYIYNLYITVKLTFYSLTFYSLDLYVLLMCIVG